MDSERRGTLADVTHQRVRTHESVRADKRVKPHADDIAHACPDTLNIHSFARRTLRHEYAVTEKDAVAPHGNAAPRHNGTLRYRTLHITPAARRQERGRQQHRATDEEPRCASCRHTHSLSKRATNCNRSHLSTDGKKSCRSLTFGQPTRTNACCRSSSRS